MSYAAIGLHHVKDHHNVGSALRAAYCFDAKMVAISGKRYRVSGTDTVGAHKILPLLVVENLLDIIPYDCVPVAIELIAGASSLHEYVHPERAFYIFGPEDGSLGKSITERCRDVIQVPTRTCLNLAATVNVVLYDRQQKEANSARTIG